MSDYYGDGTKYRGVVSSDSKIQFRVLTDAEQVPILKQHLAELACAAEWQKKALAQRDRQIEASNDKHTSGCNILNQMIDERNRQLARMYETFQSMCEYRNPQGLCHDCAERDTPCSAHWQGCPLLKEGK